MAIDSVTAALAQYAESLPWHTSTTAATSALEALQYLQLHRFQASGHAGSSLNYEAIGPVIMDIQKFLGVAQSIESGGRKAGLYKIRRRA